MPRVELASLARVVRLQPRVLHGHQLISLQRHAQRPPLDVPRCLQACRQPECLPACHLVRVRLQADLLSRHLRVLCLRQVSAFRHHLVSAWLLVLHVQAQVVSAQVLAVVLVAQVFVLVLVAHVPVVLAVSVLVLVAHVVPAALVALVARVLVLVLVLAALVVLVHVPAVPVAHLVQVVLAAVRVPAVVLAAPAVHATVNVVHLARSHVHVAGANSTNCSRSSRSTRTAMLLYPKARSSSNVVGQLRSSLRS